MTDNEIIKALECCLPTYGKKCEECPYEKLKPYAISSRTCSDKMREDVLALINRQKAEMERLEELVYLADNETANVRDLYFEEKSERAKAIKEFAERVKGTSACNKITGYGEVVYVRDIDNLVEEMVGADNAE